MTKLIAVVVLLLLSVVLLLLSVPCLVEANDPLLIYYSYRTTEGMPITVGNQINDTPEGWYEVDIYVGNHYTLATKHPKALVSKIKSEGLTVTLPNKTIWYPPELITQISYSRPIKITPKKEK